MPSRPCLTCGALTPTGSCCPAHEPVRENRQTFGRQRAEEFRHAVVEQAGRRCHPANGVALCRRYHELAERAALLARCSTP